jgi:hypothetical protein
MFVFHSEQLPHASSKDLGKGYQECDFCRVLNIVSVYGVKYPIEAEDGINHDRGVVPPSVFEAESVSQEWMFCVRVHQTPVHDNIPNTAVDGVDSCPEDEQYAQFLVLVVTPQTQAHVVKNSTHVLSKIGHMREKTSRVGISAKTLESTPDTGKRGEKSKESRMRGIALCRIVPIDGVETEEELDILYESQLLVVFRRRRRLTPRAYVSEQNMSPKKKSLNSTGKKPASSKRHYICQHKDHISEDVTHVRVGKPQTTAVVEDRERVEKNDTRDRHESHRPPGIETVISETLEVEPHEQSKKEAKNSGYLSQGQRGLHSRVEEPTSVSCRQST